MNSLSARFEYGCATAADDADLRRLMAQTAMPGSITVAFEREPDYFAGAGLHGRRTQVIAVRDAASGALAGMGVRAGAPYYVNGQPRWLGYFGELRVAAAFRRQGVLHGSAHFLHALHATDPYPAYLGVIASDNPRARRQLVQVRGPGFPPVYRVAHIRTHGIMLRRTRRSVPAAVESGSAALLPAIVDCLQRAGARRQLYPHYAPDDFDGSPRTRGFAPRDFICLRRGRDVLAVAGLWDQRAFKQQLVRSYAAGLARLRSAYNALGRAWGLPALPAVGQPIDAAFAAFIAVTDDDPALFAPLLAALAARATARGLAWLMVGLCDGDPLLPVVRRYPHITYHSDLFLTGWPDVHDFVAQLDWRVPYVEIAAL